MYVHTRSQPESHAEFFHLSPDHLSNLFQKILVPALRQKGSHRNGRTVLIISFPRLFRLSVAENPAFKALHKRFVYNFPFIYMIAFQKPQTCRPVRQHDPRQILIRRAAACFSRGARHSGPRRSQSAALSFRRIARCQCNQLFPGQSICKVCRLSRNQFSILLIDNRSRFYQSSLHFQNRKLMFCRVFRKEFCFFLIFRRILPQFFQRFLQRTYIFCFVKKHFFIQTDHRRRPG